MLFPSFFNAGPATYEIEQSLRFNKSDSARLSRTPSSAGNLKTGTISFWIKRGALQTGVNTQMSLLGCTGNGSFLLRWRYQYDYLEFNQGRSGNTGGWETLSYQRDPGAWMHIVLVNDYTNTTSTDRSRIYINGVRQDLNITSTLGDSDGSWNSANVHYIGYQAAYFDGYMAEFHNVDGTALDPTDFGEPDDNGVWRPKRYTGSYGTNGFYLKFDPSATNGIGHDHSGNGNHWTPSGFTTSGTGTDVMSDTPTTNYCTWNPLSNNGVTLSNGNLDTSGGSSGNCKGTLGMTSGKWYWEYSNIVTGVGTPFVMGLAHVDGYTPNGHDNWRRAVYFYTDGSGNGQVRRFENGSNVSADAVTVPSGIRQFVASDVLQIAFDADTGKVWTGKNNSWLDSSGGFTGNPGNGSNPTHTFPDTTIPMTPLRDHAGVAISASANFGQRAFAYTPPTGFKALNTSNLPAPTVKDGSEYFNTVLYTGNGTDNHAITGVGFQPSFTWLKTRSVVDNHVLHDEVRGANRQLFANTTDIEFTATTLLKSFDSDGFTLGTDSGANGLSRTFVAWNWLASNTSGSSNTAGTITSTVSASATSGFSIVAYEGNGTSGATVGHGLGVAPDFIVVKQRTTANHYWRTYHSSIGASKSLYLNLTNPQTAVDAGFMNNTEPTSTVFSLGNDTNMNETGEDHIAYCFAEVEGYSKFGSYTGNGSTDGPFVFCGFKPQWIMYKQSSSSGNWYLYDAERSPANGGGLDKYLIANSSAAEDSDGASNTTEDVDLLSNGFKIRDSGGAVNTSGATYIFMCFASNPFGGSGVSPATAR